VRNRYPGDKEITWCPIKRYNCRYNADGSLDANYKCSKDTLVQIGSYTLTLDLYQKTNGFKYWRNVEGCSVNVVETRRIPTRTINETIYMRQSDLSWYAMPWQITVLFFLSLAIATWLIRYLRDDFCLVCDKHLIYFKDLCFLCRLYGCERPDPNLMARLRANDEKLRGKKFRLIEAGMVNDMQEGAKKLSAAGKLFCWRKGRALQGTAKKWKVPRIFPGRDVTVEVHGR